MDFITSCQGKPSEKLALIKGLFQFLIKQKFSKINPETFSSLNIEYILNEGIHQEMIFKSESLKKKQNPFFNNKNYFYTIFLEDLGKLFFNFIDKQLFTSLYKTFKIIRNLSNSSNDMEDLVKFRLEESFGEIFVEGLEINCNVSHQLAKGLKMKSAALESDSIISTDFKSEKTLISKHSLLFRNPKQTFDSSAKQKSKNIFEKFFEHKDLSGKQMHQLEYSYLSSFELEIALKSKRLTIIVNHLHLELINLIKSLKKQEIDLNVLYQKFQNKVFGKFNVAKSDERIKYLFSQIISNKNDSQSLYLMSAKKYIRLRTNVFKRDANYIDLARIFLEYLVMHSQIIFKRGKTQTRTITTVQLQSKIMYYLKKNKSATKHKLVAALACSTAGRSLFDQSIALLLKKSLVALDQANPNRLIYSE